ncbi:M61 family metallopeptidase [Aliidiomarina sp. Khilg15.8]
MTAPALHYLIEADDCAGHYFNVTLSIQKPHPDGQVLRLAAWLPGSYMVRDFAKHIVEFRADYGKQTLGVQRLDKQSWKLQPCDGPVTVTYKVYARDLSVRTAYLDTLFGFYNHSALCLEVVDQHETPCEVDIQLPPGQPDWQLATGMPRRSGDAFSSGTFYAENYADLIDYPVLMGELSLEDFIVKGTRHRVALVGRHFADMERICGDLASICDAQLELFADEAPFEDYTFLVMVTGNGFGGLEHRNSTALVCGRKDLIHRHQQQITDGYRTFLSLCSHEYFHSWNVKRLRPREFIPFDLSREQYTEQLWFYEGITSYYDDYMLHRTALTDARQYLDTLGQTISRALFGRGPQRQTITESSWLAWTTFYQQNENAPNAIASYYSKGAVTALCADLIIRQHSNHQHSLDDAMRTLWQGFGKHERGTSTDDLLEVLGEFGGEQMGAFLQRALYSTELMPVAALLADFGIEVQMQSAATKADEQPVSLGARFNASEQGLELTHVFEGGSAYDCGLSAGDRIIAIDSLQITAGNESEFWSRYQPGDRVQVHAFRRDELLSLDLFWQAPDPAQYVLKIKDASKLNGWLSVPRGQE